VRETSHGIAVARENVIEMYDDDARFKWTATGVEHPSQIASDEHRLAILDSWSNRVRVIDARSGEGETYLTAETPVAAVFSRGALFVVSRDASVVERIDAGGARITTPVAPDPVFIRESAGRVLVYSRRDGVLQEVSHAGKITRSATVGAFASDVEVDGATAYLLFPAEARMAMVSLESLEVERSVAIGAVPSDLAIARSGNALNAPLIVVADPGSLRLWRTEGAQSVGAAFGRGFLRGLLGLNLFRPRSSEFPSGVDRVVARGGVTVAFDSATGTLYRARGDRSDAIAQGLEPEAFAIVGSRIAMWRGGRLVLVN
jgi:hypothetical protein